MGACGGKEASSKEANNRRGSSGHRVPTPTKKNTRSSSILQEIRNLPKPPQRKSCRYLEELEGQEFEEANMLFNAIEDGITATIQLLKKEVDPNVLDADGDAPLHHAIVSPSFHSELGIHILEFLATPAVLSSAPHSLELACAAGRVTAAQKLLDLNAPVIGSEILAVASQSSDDDDDKECFETPAGLNVLTRIISMCPKSISESDDADTPLHLSLVNGKPQLSALLLHHKVDTNIKDSNKRLPLHNVMCLPENNESVCLVLYFLWILSNPINYQKSNKQVGLVKQLLTSSTVNEPDVEGDSPLHWAAYFDRTKAARVCYY